jgi:hypothetical protein
LKIDDKNLEPLATTTTTTKITYIQKIKDNYDLPGPKIKDTTQTGELLLSEMT